MLFQKKYILYIIYFFVFTIDAQDKGAVAKTNNKNKLAQMELPESSVPTKNKNNESIDTQSKKLDYDGKNQIVFCINREAILEKCALAKEMRNELQELDQKLYNEIKPLATEFEKKQEEFQKKTKTLSREALAKEEQEMMQIAQEFQMKNMESQELLKREEMRIIREFAQVLSKSCKEFLLRDENVHVVLIPVDNATYVHSQYDATDKILEIMDAEFLSNKKATSKNNKKDLESKASTKKIS